MLSALLDPILQSDHKPPIRKRTLFINEPHSYTSFDRRNSSVSLSKTPNQVFSCIERLGDLFACSNTANADWSSFMA